MTDDEIRRADLPEQTSAPPQSSEIMIWVGGVAHRMEISLLPQGAAASGDFITGLASVNQPPTPAGGFIAGRSTWLDTSVTPNEFRVWNGTSFVTIGPAP